MQNVWLSESQDGINNAGRNINNLRYADDTTLMAESEEELKSFLMEVKQKSEKAGLKHIKKTKIMAPGPITSWQTEEGKVETAIDFIFLDSKMTVDSGYSHKIKLSLLLGRKAMTNLDSILKKQRHHFADKGLYSQSYGFSSKQGHMPKNWESWIVLEKTLESPLDSKEIKPVNPKGNQPWIFTGRTDAEAETTILWPHDAKIRLTGKDSDAGKDERQKEKGVAEIKWLDSITDSTDMNLSKVWEIVEDGWAWRATVHGITKRQTQLSDWTTATKHEFSPHYQAFPNSTMRKNTALETRNTIYLLNVHHG